MSQEGEKPVAAADSTPTIEPAADTATPAAVTETKPTPAQVPEATTPEQANKAGGSAVGSSEDARLSDKKYENPSALEVIQNMINPDEEQRASAHMKGHISKTVIDDTFLFEAKEIYPESTLRINCMTHNAPATFYSKAEQKYKCLKCIVASEDLHYIDKKYKSQLEEFEQIKSYTAKAILENEPNISIIKRWKEGIRDTLVKVKSEYIEWIESFTNKFVKSLNKIEQSRELNPFVGEDKKQELRLIEMQTKYHDILKIFYKIQQTKPDDKLVTIQSFRDEMQAIQQFVIVKDKEIKKQAHRVDKASRETVDLDGLALKIKGKYLKFLQSRAVQPSPSNLPAPPVQPTIAITGGMTNNNFISDDTSIQFSEHPIQTSAQVGANTNKLINKAQSYANKVGTNSKPQVDLNTSVMTVSSRYRHENQNSIYYLRPNSNDIYFLDFDQKGFVPEQLKWHKNKRGQIPSQITSVQSSDSSIFVIGGTRQSITPIPDTLMIDANMTVYEREPMKTARYCAPLAMVRDRFILALGGFTGRSSTTKVVECYDTLTNHWFNTAPLPGQSANCTAVVMNERWIYLMPGANRDAQAGNSLYINLLDTGASSSFEGERNSKDYGAAIARQKWSQLEVTNAEFVQAQPVAGIQFNSTDMLIFGGESLKTFQFDTREVQQINKQASVRTCQSKMGSKAKFGYSSDYIARTFGQFIYSIDAAEQCLHVFDMNQNKWTAVPLTQFRIPRA